MFIQKVGKMILISALSVTILQGCSNNSIIKSSELIEIESFYQKTATELQNVQNAEEELSMAEDALKAASMAETEDEMDTLVYVANNHIKSAIRISDTENTKKKIEELKVLRVQLREEFSSQRKKLMSLKK